MAAPPAPATGSGARGRRRLRRRIELLRLVAHLVEGEGGRASHASRSPSRNSSARSRRMWGSDRVRPSAVRLELRRAEAGEAHRQAPPPPSKTDSGSSGKSPGNHAISVLPSNTLPSTVSPGWGVPMIVGSAVAALASPSPRGWRAPRPAPAPRRGRRRSGRARWRGPPAGRGSPPAGRGRRGGAGRPWWRRTGCGRCAGCTSPLSQLVRPRRKEPRMAASAASRSATATGPALSAVERIDHDDLAVEAGEVVAEEGPHDGVAIGLVAPRHHVGERACRALVAVFQAERREGQRRRIVEVAGHQEAARRLGGEQAAVGAAGAQIGGEDVGQLARQRLVGRRMRRRPSASRFSHGHGVVAVAVAGGGGDRLARPVGIALGEQRQVEQPFAGIVDDVDVEPAAADRAGEERGRFVVDRQAQLADLAGRIRATGAPRPARGRGARSRSGAPRRRAAARAGRR